MKNSGNNHYLQTVLDVLHETKEKKLNRKSESEKERVASEQDGRLLTCSVSSSTTSYGMTQ